MQTNRFLLPELSPVDFSITFSSLVRQSPLNHNESHMHKECEIYLNLSGTASFEVEQRLYPITRGSVVVTRPYEYHHYIYHDEEPHQHYWITFSPGKADEVLSLFFDREKGFGNLIQLDESALCRMEELLNGLLDNRLGLLEKRIGFLQMLCILQNGEKLPSTDYSDSLSPDVIAALQYIDHNLTEEIGVKSLAAACGVSVNTLERHFKEQLFLSPSAMVRKTRLIKSMQHLRQGCTISEAADRCGFPDYSNYIQLFRRQFGMTPLQYRKNLV